MQSNENPKVSKQHIPLYKGHTHTHTQSVCTWPKRKRAQPTSPRVTLFRPNFIIPFRHFLPLFHPRETKHATSLDFSALRPPRGWGGIGWFVPEKGADRASAQEKFTIPCRVHIQTRRLRGQPEADATWDGNGNCEKGCGGVYARVSWINATARCVAIRRFRRDVSRFRAFTPAGVRVFTCSCEGVKDVRCKCLELQLRSDDCSVIKQLQDARETTGFTALVGTIGLFEMPSRARGIFLGYWEFG